MVTKNIGVLTLARRVKPDGQCLTVFITALLTTAIPPAWNHVQIISDASANLRPITQATPTKAADCQTITPALQENSVLLSSVIEKELAPIKLPAVAAIEKTKIKPVARKIKPRVNKRNHLAAITPLRMKVIGTQDGVAWYVDNYGDVRQVAVGDVVPGIGKIGVIRNDRTIKTEDGRLVLTEQVN